MTDNGFWTCPADREVLGWGDYTITIVHPPFPAATPAPHDPVAARRFVAAFGITAEELAGQDAELDEPSSTDWSAFGNLALGLWDPWHLDTVEMSAFRVRHTESYTSLMEEIWRFEY
jgi:hypothetical protein